MTKKFTRNLFFEQMWAIFGGNGWIGSQLLPLLQTKGIEYDLPDFQLEDPKHLETYLLKKKPVRVLCLVGRTRGGSYNTNENFELGRPQLRENIRDNLFSPVMAALVCKNHGIHFTYLGTGCIFSNTEGKSMFEEEDKPNFFGSGCSIVKGYTDQIMHLLKDHVLQLRIRMPITEDFNDPRNFIAKLLQYEKICSVPNSMTVLPDLLPVFVDLVVNKKTGTYNLTNPGVISHNEILDMYKTMIDPTFTYTNCTLEEQNRTLLSERPNNGWKTTKLEKEYFILPIYQSLQRLFKRVRKHRLQNQSYTANRIMVTGGFGFIGSNFLHFLAKQGSIEVLVNVDKEYYCSRREHLEGIEVINEVVDINQTEKISNLLETYRIDTVVHFAAQSHVDNSFGNSICFTMDNTRGTHSLLEASRTYGKLKRFLHISTDEVYGENLSNEGFLETLCPNPTNPYAATKIAAEFLVQSYYHCFELPILIIRGNNVYGPRQFPEKIISRFIMQVLHDKPCTIAGNGCTRRNFVFVQDFCEAVFMVLHRGIINEIYNIGTTNEHSVTDIAKIIIHHLKGPNVAWKDHIVSVPDRFYNDFTYRINTDKLRALGWKERTPFEKGIRETCEYYSRYRNLYNEAPLN